VEVSPSPKFHKNSSAFVELLVNTIVAGAFTLFWSTSKEATGAFVHEDKIKRQMMVTKGPTLISFISLVFRNLSKNLFHLLVEGQGYKVKV
jgi:hypothetical protein